MSGVRSAAIFASPSARPSHLRAEEGRVTGPVPVGTNGGDPPPLSGSLRPCLYGGKHVLDASRQRGDPWIVGPGDPDPGFLLEAGYVVQEVHGVQVPLLLEWNIRIDQIRVDVGRHIADGPRAWLVTDARAELMGGIRALARTGGTEPVVARFKQGGIDIRPLPVVHTSRVTFGYMISVEGRRIVCGRRSSSCSPRGREAPI
jgi:hypothetical protein